MAKITSWFPAVATGWMNLGTLKKLGVGGDPNFNLKRKKKVAWPDESNVSGLKV